jgi:hypothetical protein
MFTRRAFICVIAASVSTGPGIRADDGLIGKLKSGLNWFIEIVKETPSVLEHIYDWLLRSKAGYKILVDSRGALNDVRRKLADPSTEKALQSKLRAWLKRYDQITSEEPRPGESRPQLVARQRTEFELLKADWDSLKKDAVDALHEIGRLQDEIESIDPGTLHGDEYRTFKLLLQQKREEDDFLKIENPTDPTVIDRLREVADQLDETIRVIAKNAPALDAAIKKAG